MARNYPRLDIETFGAHLLASGDLDPIYIALRETFVHPAGSLPQLSRWMIAYWCLYHAGSACWLSEHDEEDFWHELLNAAGQRTEPPCGGRWQRGHERRHFRGLAAENAVSQLAMRFPRPELLVDYLVTGRERKEPHRDTFELPIDFGKLAKRAQELPLFGPWISFKICDMVDRVLGHEVDFSADDVFMFKDPTQAALKLWCLKAGLPEGAKPKDEKTAIKHVVTYLTGYFKDVKAPPLGDRPVGLQEVETILCKWKSHCNGHYPLNNDIDEINEGLKPWLAHSEVARDFLKAMPKGDAR